MSPADIRRGRKRHGLTQAALGEALGVSRVTVGEWESGRQVPTPANLAELARVLDGGAAPAPSGPMAPVAPTPPAAPSPEADPSWWAGYLAAANETLRHAHAMIGGANEQIAHMLRNRAQWQRPAPPEQPDPFAEFPAYDFSPAAEAAREARRAADEAGSGGPAAQPARRRRAG